MASLTPLSKGLIALAVVGAMTSAVWHLGLKERFSPSASAPPTVQTPNTPPLPPPAQVVTPAPTSANPAQTMRNGRSAADNADTGRKLLASGDFAQARIHLEQAVRDGDGSAACLLGEMTLKGQGGIAADQEKSATLFQLAQTRNTICFTPAQ
ncbi:MAG: hypothetical protein IPH35_26955 [Rhodoferax sp.]|nr:hypothetical protein [Rhodoferax sp.]